MDPVKHQPMQARASEVSTSTSGRPKAPPVSLDDPDALLAEILALLDKEHFKAARALAIDAARRFPEHARLEKARVALAGKATIRPGGPEPGIEEEIEWLRNPPEDARGKWVALSGSELVGAAETAAELAEILRSRDSSLKTLVFRVD